MASSRDIRQEQCINNWIKAKGHATIVAATGFGREICRSIEKFIELSSGNIGRTP